MDYLTTIYICAVYTDLEMNATRILLGMCGLEKVKHGSCNEKLHLIVEGSLIHREEEEDHI